MGFQTAHAFVHKWEGGERFTMDPQDPGGATRFGISFRFLEDLPLARADVDQDGVVTWQDVRALDRDRAEALYREYFWNRLHLDDLPRGLALALYDTAVNLGRARAVRYLQQALGVACDGVMGPETMGALRKQLAAGQEPELINQVLFRREAHYLRLAERKAWAARFVRGWLNRLKDLRQTIKEMSQ